MPVLLSVYLPLKKQPPVKHDIVYCGDCLFFVEKNIKKDISNCDRTYVEKRIPTQYEITSYIVATGADPIP